MATWNAFRIKIGRTKERENNIINPSNYKKVGAPIEGTGKPEREYIERYHSLVKETEAHILQQVEDKVTRSNGEQTQNINICIL